MGEPLPSPTHTGIVGHLRVHCVGATNLPAADFVNLGPLASSDPYMIVYLKNRDNLRQSQQHSTRTVRSSLNPVWRDEFWFSLRKHPIYLDIHFDVFDYDHLKEDDFLGETKLLLDWSLLKEAELTPIVRELPLQRDPMRSRVPASGKIKIEISWHPSSNYQHLLGEDKSYVKLMLRSPHMLRVVGLAMLGMAGLLLLIAQNMRWLCRGHSLPNCHMVDVKGADRCALLGALCAFTAFAIHIHGYAGFCGAGWMGHPPSLIELAEAAAETDERFETMAKNPKGFEMKVEPISVKQFNISVGTPSLPKMSLAVVRLATWLLHLAGLTLSTLAATLAWLEDGPPDIFGEATYLVAGAASCFVVSMCAYVRERVIWRESRKRNIRLQYQRHATSSDLAEPLLDQHPLPGADRRVDAETQPLPAKLATGISSPPPGRAGAAAETMETEIEEPQQRRLSHGSGLCCQGGAF